MEGSSNMSKKNKDPFGFGKAINWNKLEDPKVLKELKKLFDEEETKLIPMTEEEEYRNAGITKKEINENNS